MAGRGDNPALPRRLRVVFASLRGRIRAVALEYIPGRNRVQAPAAPGFYRSCADALTEGLSPQSGLVQREYCMLPAAVPPLVAGATTFPTKGDTMGAEQWRQFEFMAAAERKPYNRASPGGKQANLAVLVEMHPFWCCAPLPPKGEVCSTLSF